MSKKNRRFNVVDTDTPTVEETVISETAPEVAPEATLAQETPAEVVVEAPVEITATEAPAEIVPVTSALYVGREGSGASGGRKYPKVGGNCWAVWDRADSFLDNNIYPTSAMMKEEAIREGWNLSNTSQEFYAWRRFRGVR